MKTLSIKEAAEYTREAVLAGPWDQSEALYSPDTPCCVGAKLADFLTNGVSFEKGASAFCTLLGLNPAQVVLLLRAAGAGHAPFSATLWPLSREKVWDNLSKIERAPKTAGADFTDVSFSSMALPGADFRDADLRRAYFRAADLRKADFRNADLRKATCSKAKLRRANFSNANLCEASFRDADLRGANFSNADLRGGNFSEADLCGADFSNAEMGGMADDGALYDEDAYRSMGSRIL